MSAIRLNPPGLPVAFHNLGPDTPYVNPFRFSGEFVRPLRDAPAPVQSTRRGQLAAAARRYRERRRYAA